MEKSIRVSFGGQNVKVADLLVNRLLPSELCSKVGPFVFLDHVYPTTIKKQTPDRPAGLNAHPHRGVATLTYQLSGSLEHFDSCNHKDIVDEGGVHWLKAGKGVMHEERPTGSQHPGVLHALQFWVNLPSANKKDNPSHQALATCDIPEAQLPDNAGSIRILLGKSGDLVSPIPTFLDEFNYHVKLNPKSSFSYRTSPDLEYAVFVPAEEIHVNDEVAGKSHLLVLSSDKPAIRLYNPGIVEAHAFIFGGSEYREPIVAQGPFVMNSRQEVVEAYNDFFEGKYGVISTGTD